jgi:hypothetical protein
MRVNKDWCIWFVKSGHFRFGIAVASGWQTSTEGDLHQTLYQ